MGLFTWTKKLLTVKGKLAINKACCCKKGWYCILTKAGDYECRNTPPDLFAGEQLLDEFKTEDECKKSCFKPYYCYHPNPSTYDCVPEDELPNGTDDPDILSGPFPQSQCDDKCTECKPCYEAACKFAACGGDPPTQMVNWEDSEECKNGNPFLDLVYCCESLNETWKYSADIGGWEMTSACGDGRPLTGNTNLVCEGNPPGNGSFPQNANDGDEVQFPCKPSFDKFPKNQDNCPNCTWNCEDISIPSASQGDPPKQVKECKRNLEKKTYRMLDDCLPSCADCWRCTSPTECIKYKCGTPSNEERASRAADCSPFSAPFDNEADCLACAAIKCKPPESWICNPQCGNKKPDCIKLPASSTVTIGVYPSYDACMAAGCADNPCVANQLQPQTVWMCGGDCGCYPVCSPLGTPTNGTTTFASLDECIRKCCILPKTCTVKINPGKPKAGNNTKVQNALESRLSFTTPKLSGAGGSWSLTYTPDGASAPITVSVSLRDSTGKPSVSVYSGAAGITQAQIEKQNMLWPLQGTNPAAVLCWFALRGREDDGGNGTILPAPAMTSDNICAGTKTFVFPAFLYQELGYSGGYSDGTNNGYTSRFPFFLDSDGYGEPMVSLEVTFE